VSLQSFFFFALRAFIFQSLGLPRVSGFQFLAIVAVAFAAPCGAFVVVDNCHFLMKCLAARIWIIVLFFVILRSLIAATFCFLGQHPNRSGVIGQRLDGHRVIGKCVRLFGYLFKQVVLAVPAFVPDQAFQRVHLVLRGHDVAHDEGQISLHWPILPLEQADD
jgi:hypothetical protein